MWNLLLKHRSQLLPRCSFSGQPRRPCPRTENDENITYSHDLIEIKKFEAILGFSFNWHCTVPCRPPQISCLCFHYWPPLALAHPPGQWE